MIKRNYNLDKLKELSDNNPEFMDKMVAVFLSEIPSDLSQLMAAVESGNRLVVNEYANKMKPTIELFSIECLSDLRILLEWSKTNDPIVISTYARNIQHQLTTVISQLKEDF